MKREEWDEVVWPVILQHEVGPFMATGGYVNNPADPGGATKWGISLRYLRALPKWVGDLNGDGVVNALDIRGATAEQAANLYWRDWQASGYGKWLSAASVPLVVKVFDIRVNAGPRRAHILLQRCLGPASAGAVATADDGVIGPKTRAAVRRALQMNTAGVQSVLVALGACQAEFYRSIGTGKRAQFLGGWLRRAHWQLADFDRAGGSAVVLAP